MESASKYPTQAMTSQETRDWVASTKGTQKDSIQQHALPTTKSPDFLRLIPFNETAKLAFSELLARKRAGTLSDHHGQYLVDNGKGLLRKPINYQARSEGETTDEEYPDAPEPREVNLGFFKVSFDHVNVTQSAKWVIGRGSARKGEGKITRNVDILLAAPGSQHTTGLLAAHAYLRMHPDSGVWMIQAAPESSNHSTESGPMVMATLGEKDILNNGFRCLDKPETRLSILDMDFHVQFALTTYPACESYRQLRNRKLEEYDMAVPDTDISGIPLNSDIRAKDLAVFSLGLGSGANGAVYEAFDPESGELRIVKVVEVKNESVRESLQPEIEMLKRYPNTRGLVRQYGWCNSNWDTTLTVEKYPLNVYLVQRKGKAFNRQSWKDTPAIERLKAFQDLLCGLRTIHQQGWMHRDITRQNILYFNGNPPEAALCDFGKLCFRKIDTYTGLAAWSNLPPEIVEGESNPYNQSIDIWMLALALVLTWCPQACQGVARLYNGQITSVGLEVIRSWLLNIKNSNLALLLQEMLSKDPKSRPNVDQALSHPTFQHLKTESTQEAVSSEGKRRRLEEDTIDVETAKNQAMRLGQKETG
uniref:Putative kinase n=1 Tax=Cladonia uncialis subsp. uncialis TaxID=180999 RepID=A0A2K9YDU8_CLAUC|nr:putative kinase [Cladonia uncialis subsp. uncialis]